jgi:hypothetical protein
MAEPKTDRGAVYETLRRELIHVLMERRSRGHFTWVTERHQSRTGTLLCGSNAQHCYILVAAYPKKDPNAYIAPLADAETIVSSVLDRGLLTSLQIPMTSTSS